MRMTEDYYRHNALIAIRLRLPDGAKYYDYQKLYAVDDYTNQRLAEGCKVLKTELCESQPDEHIRNFLNKVWYNWHYNPQYSFETDFEKVLEDALNAEVEVA